jgi:hypothetical protein
MLSKSILSFLFSFFQKSNGILEGSDGFFESLWDIIVPFVIFSDLEFFFIGFSVKQIG